MANPLKQKVNFYISISFIASFALFVTVMTAETLQVSLPFIDSAAASIAAN